MTTEEVEDIEYQEFNDLRRGAWGLRSIGIMGGIEPMGTPWMKGGNMFRGGP